MAIWLNRWDIDEAVRTFKADPVLGPAAKFLPDYRDLVDSLSDGWPYWSAGTKCASDLESLLHEAMGERYSHEPDYMPPTRADVEMAARKIALFIGRNKYMREAGAKPPVLAEAVQPALF